MLSETTIRELVSTPSFISNASRLAYALHISHQDASQELLIELLDHRLRLWTNKDVTLAIVHDAPSLKWKVKYAAKDCYRNTNKIEQQELTKVQMLAGMEPQPTNEDEISEAINVLPNLFKNKATQSWVESVIQVGQKETMVRFGQTPRQFNSKLTKVCKYACKHQKNRMIEDNSKELKLLKEWDNLMAHEQTDDGIVHTFIDQHKEYIDKIIDDPQVAFQGRLIKDFEHAGKDRYTLANLMNRRMQELKENK